MVWFHLAQSHLQHYYLKINLQKKKEKQDQQTLLWGLRLLQKEQFLIRFLHENSFDFKPQFKLYVNTNYLPAITDMTLFSSGRVVIIPFDRHFEEWEQEQNLKAEFSRPEAASAILNWLIEGYTILKEEGFAQPKAVKDATMSYQHDSDKMELFVEEFLEQEKDAECRTSAVYQAYRNWCNDNGYFAENSRNFNQALRTIGTIVRRRPRDGGEKTTLLTGYRLLCRDFFC